MQENPNLTRGIGFSAVIYGVLFVGHIAAAANDLIFLFHAIAVSITIMTFLMGPIIWFLSGPTPDSVKLTFRIGFWASVPLSLGLAYAYAGQSFDAAYSLAFLSFTTITHFLAIRLRLTSID